MERNGYFGRRILYATPPESYTAKTVGKILDDVIQLHEFNAKQIEDLYWIYRGDQEILTRSKTIRPEINNRVVENRAFEVVEFKKGYEFSHPVQYTNAGQSDSAPLDILNTYSRLDGKEAKDLALAEWEYIAGTSYRICLPKVDATIDDAPYYSGVLAPKNAFVVYSSDVQRRPIIAGSRTCEKDGSGNKQWRYGVYAGNVYFEWVVPLQGANFASTTPDKTKKSPMGIPIVEYPLNESRIGYVELCIHLFNAINSLGSNRMDSVDQFVQALLVFINCELDEDDDGNPVIPRSGDAVMVTGKVGVPADVKYLVEQLNQDGIQVQKEDLLNAINEICGIPSRQARNSGGGDTGQAVVLRNGWGAAEARAKSTEKLFKKSELEYLKLVLRICRDTSSAAAEIGDLTLRDVDVRFTRNRSDNMQVKAQTLDMLLKCGVNPEDAYEYCEMFSDPTAVWLKSQRYQMEKVDTGQSADVNINAPDASSEDGKLGLGMQEDY